MEIRGRKNGEIFEIEPNKVYETQNLFVDIKINEHWYVAYSPSNGAYVHMKGVLLKSKVLNQTIIEEIQFNLDEGEDVSEFLAPVQ